LAAGSPYRQRLGDRRDNVPEVVGEQVRAAHEHGRTGGPRLRVAARLRCPVAKLFDHLAHALTGIGGDVAAAVEHPGERSDRHPGLRRDGAHGHPAGPGNKI